MDAVAVSSTTIHQSDLVVAIIVEGVGLAAVTIAAGVSNDVGTIMVILMIGLWMLFLMHHGNVTTWLSNLMANVQSNLNGVSRG